MKKKMLYALDFDGVICDSALETGVSAWKAAAQIWDDFLTDLPTAEQSAQFRQIRPVMGTGYEAVLIVRMLNNGDTVADIIDDYQHKCSVVMQADNLTVDQLKKVFAETRDNWIKQDLDSWLAMNPLFPGLVEKLQGLSKSELWYIVTTKQERFVQQILQANAVEMAAENIFGLDRKLSKPEVLTLLLKKHPEHQLCFVEDMLPTLLKVRQSPELADIQLLLADWGYNTEQERTLAKQQAIELIAKNQFLKEYA